MTSIKINDIHIWAFFKTNELICDFGQKIKFGYFNENLIRINLFYFYYLKMS